MSSRQGASGLLRELAVDSGRSGPGASQGGTALASTLWQLGRPGGLTRGFTIAAGFIGLLVFVLFTTNITGEYALGTVRVLLTRQPRPAAGRQAVSSAGLRGGPVACGRAASAAAVALAHGLDVSTAAWFTTDGLSHLAGDYANAVLTATVFGAVGISLGVFTRSTPIALGIGLAWLGPLEHILQLSWSGAARWLPGLIVDAVASGGTSVTTYQRALVTALVYTGLAVSAATVSFVRRDVSL